MDSCRRVSYNRSSAAHPLHLSGAHTSGPQLAERAHGLRGPLSWSVMVSLSLSLHSLIFTGGHTASMPACASPAAERCPNLGIRHCYPSTCTYPALPSMPGHAVSHHAMPCHSMCHRPTCTWPALPPKTPPSACYMPCHGMTCLRPSMPGHVMSGHVMPCHAMPCHAMPCHATLSPVPSHGVSYHAVPYHTPQWYEGHHDGMKDAHNTRTWATRLTRTQQPHAEWRLEDLRIALNR